MFLPVGIPMKSQDKDGRDIDLSFDEKWSEIDVGTRIDLNGKTTYHMLTSNSRADYFIEKVYDDKHNLVRIIKRSTESRSETDFDPGTGDATRIFESSQLPDGSLMTKEIVYAGQGSIETVVVISSEGDLVRTVQRDFVGVKTIYQAQTDYKPNGMPAETINHTMDEATGKLVHREQIKWLRDGQRSLTEHFYFTVSGTVDKYVKVLYHANGAPFVEETHRYGGKGYMLRREIIQYNADGVQTAADLTMFDETGDILQRSTTYYDHRGTISSLRNVHCSDQTEAYFGPGDDDYCSTSGQDSYHLP